MNVLKFILLIVFVLGLSNTIQAEKRTVGIGATIGTVNGIDYTIWTSDIFALSSTISFSITEDNLSFYKHLDFIGNNYLDNLNLSNSRTSFFGGVGFSYNSMDSIDDDIYSIRVPFGTSIEVNERALDLIIKIAPTLDVQPEYQFYFAGNISFRYYLKSFKSSRESDCKGLICF